MEVRHCRCSAEGDILSGEINKEKLDKMKS